MRALLLLCVLLGLAFFAKPGHRYNPVNRAYAAVRIWGELEVDFDRIDTRLTEADLATRHPSLSFECERDDGLGDRVCKALVRRFNGSPAWRTAFYFKAGTLKALWVDLTPEGYAQCRAQLTATQGEPRAVPNDGTSPPLMAWVQRAGQVVLPITPEEKLTGLLWTIRPGT